MAAEGTCTVIVVVAKATETFSCQSFVPALEGFGFHDFATVIIVVDEVCHVHDAHIGDIAGETACVGENSNVHALQSLVDHVFLSAELAGGVNGDFYMSVGIFKNFVCCGFHAGVNHGGIGLCGGELELIGLVCAGRGTECEYHAESKDQCEKFFHFLFLLNNCGITARTDLSIF